MQHNLFDDLKVLKDKMSQEEKKSNTQKIENLKQEKEKKLQDQFLDFVKDAGIRKIN
ncbi:MAG: hypothetical protein PHR87_02870 [Sulfurospirillaceae bacterium]|nr:hypothetical protein [Sulfurospirillaceae bacterium]